MTIKIGDKIPTVNLKVMRSHNTPIDITTTEIFSEKRVVLVAVPGAFTPGCSLTHLPGYVVHYDAFKAKGIDTVACVSVNDVYVMDAWMKEQNAENILMLADGSADLTKAMGVTLDLNAAGLGIRSRRYSLVAQDGVVEILNAEKGGEIEVSTAEKLLAQL